MRRLCHILDPFHLSPCPARTSRLCQHLAQSEDPARLIIILILVNNVECFSPRPIILQIIGSTSPVFSRTYTQPPKQATMAGEVTRKQPELQIAAEDPPSFHQAGNPDDGWE